MMSAQAPTSLTVEPREFTFTWREDGATKRMKLAAESYPDACWMLGAIQYA